MKTTDDGMYSYEEFDLKDQAHKHKMELEREQTRRTELDKNARIKESRAGAAQNIGITVAVVGGIVGIVYFVGSWIIQPDPPADQDPDVIRESKCVDNGGVWLDEDFLVSGKSACFFPKNDVSSS